MSLIVLDSDQVAAASAWLTSVGYVTRWRSYAAMLWILDHEYQGGIEKFVADLETSA